MDWSNPYEAALHAYSLHGSEEERGAIVYYRILSAPPGYPPHQKYMVAAYSTLEYTSYLGGITKEDGSRFAETLEEARRMIPVTARRLPLGPEYQFLELWESALATESRS